MRWMGVSDRQPKTWRRKRGLNCHLWVFMEACLLSAAKNLPTSRAVFGRVDGSAVHSVLRWMCCHRRPVRARDFPGLTDEAQEPVPARRRLTVMPRYIMTILQSLCILCPLSIKRANCVTCLTTGWNF
jgi:hypothetical protein